MCPTFADGIHALVFVMSINCAVAETVLVGTFFNGNSDHLHSRAYIWNPTGTDASIKARAYTLPRSGSSVLMGEVDLGLLNARSGRNIKIAEDILDALGHPLPYVTDGGNPMVEFTVEADGVRGTGQVFSSDLAFGTYPLDVMSSSTTPPADHSDPPEGQKDLETSVSYRVTERGNSYWSFSWILDITNNTATEGQYDARINFLDAGGFIVDYGYGFNLTVPAGSTNTFRGQELITSEGAATVVSVEAVVTPE